MTFDLAAEKFNTWLKDINLLLPAVELDEDTIVFHNYIIKKNKLDQWDLIQVGKKLRNIIASFNLKSSALMAAKAHKNNRIMHVHRIIDLDQRYWSNYIDTVLFRERYKQTKDLVKRDIFLWRYEQSLDRVYNYKQKITSAFHAAFS